MKIALFFSYGISLLDWKNNGTLNREIKIYKELSKLGYKFFFITYGDTRDLNLINDKNIEVIPLFKNGSSNKIVKIIKTIFIPFILRKKLAIRMADKPSFLMPETHYSPLSTLIMVRIFSSGPSTYKILKRFSISVVAMDQLVSY